MPHLIAAFYCGLGVITLINKGCSVFRMSVLAELIAAPTAHLEHRHEARTCAEHLNVDTKQMLINILAGGNGEVVPIVWTVWQLCQANPRFRSRRRLECFGCRGGPLDRSVFVHPISLIGGLSGNPGVRSVPIAAADPAGQTSAPLRAGLERVEIQALVFQRSPQPFDEHIVHPAPAAVHADRDLGILEHGGKGKATELTALDALLSVKQQFGCYRSPDCVAGSRNRPHEQYTA